MAHIFTAGEVMLPMSSAIRVGSATLLSGVRSDVQPGQLILLEDDDHTLLGAIPEERLPRELSGDDAPLHDLMDKAWALARVSPFVPISEVTRLMAEEPMIRWHVVEEAGTLVGILPPFVAYLGEQLAPFSHVWAVNPAGRTYGQSITPHVVNWRMCCQANPKHCISMEDARKEISWPHVRCSIDNTMMISTSS